MLDSVTFMFESDQDVVINNKKRHQKDDNIVNERVGEDLIDTKAELKGPEIQDINLHRRMKKLEMEMHRLRKCVGEWREETRELNVTIKSWMNLSTHSQHSQGRPTFLPNYQPTFPSPQLSP
ncbi:uncharacterized protein LOC128668455 [Microplitis demolitor]|uniref:uncharacterized protein LOC128668455 n=1 Tax=Microplitis demolitor TaxID=69319 RepID=UPI0004CDAAEF|nr:uncharacterized protein LOC128668455 [Microplitis demolitor]